MFPLLNTFMHALLVAAWTTTGYSVVLLAAHPCSAHASIAAIQAISAGALLWFVWPSNRSAVA